jgi:hypothetical protein
MDCRSKKNCEFVLYKDQHVCRMTASFPATGRIVGLSSRRSSTLVGVVGDWDGDCDRDDLCSRGGEADVDREAAWGGLLSLVGDVAADREVDREDLLSLRLGGEFRNFVRISTTGRQFPYIKVKYIYCNSSMGGLEENDRKNILMFIKSLQRHESYMSNEMRVERKMITDSWGTKDMQVRMYGTHASTYVRYDRHVRTYVQ